MSDQYEKMERKTLEAVARRLLLQAKAEHARAGVARRKLAELRREVRSVATHTGVSDDMAVRLDAAADRSELRKKGA